MISTAIKHAQNSENTERNATWMIRNAARLLPDRAGHAWIFIRRAKIENDQPKPTLDTSKNPEKKTEDKPNLLNCC
jgi:hypothetical protein